MGQFVTGTPEPFLFWVGHAERALVHEFFKNCLLQLWILTLTYVNAKLAWW